MMQAPRSPAARPAQAGRLPRASSRAPARAPSRAARGRLACHASVVWRQLERSGAWLAHPRAARTRGVVHFLGGAFAGAAPQLLYNSFIEGLAEAGYAVVATPYRVTFRHDACARQVRQSFLDSLAELRATGRSYLAPPAAPQYGVGHSNGALLHLLIGAYEPGASDANVIISYNNLQVSDAIPIPGFLDSLQPTVQAARAANAQGPPASGSTSSADEGGSGSGSSSSSSSSSSGGGDQLLAAAASLPLSEQQALLLAGAGPAIDQLSSIVNEVGDGTTDFSPSPEESRAIVRAGYACPATLLVQFENDAFDETPEMQQLLAGRLAAAAAPGAGAGASSSSTAPAGDGGGAGAGVGGASGYTSGYTSAWNSMDEDVSMEGLLQQLQELQASLQQQEQAQLQQLQQLQGGGGSGGGGQPALLQQLLLPGSHVTPCGAQLPTGAAGPLDVLLSQPSSQAEQQQLIERVVAFLDGRRQPAVVRRTAKKQQQQQQQQQGVGPAPVAAAAPDCRDGAAQPPPAGQAAGVTVTG